MKKIILKGGPLDNETDLKVEESAVIYQHGARGPSARYKDTGVKDANGYHIFEHHPRKPAEPETTEGVHDAE